VGEVQVMGLRYERRQRDKKIVFDAAKDVRVG
jgi:hypothetical protein